MKKIINKLHHGWLVCKLQRLRLMKKMLTSIVLRGHKVPSLFFRATIPYSKLSSPFQTSVCKLVLVWRKEEISGQEPERYIDL